MVVDIDPEEDKGYYHWSPGGLKEYVSGQLGDLVFLEKNQTKFGSYNCKIEWLSNEVDKLPEFVKIKSQEYDEWWVNTKLDSLGNIDINLPVGNYAIYPFYKTGSEGSGHGYDNQLRVDDNYKRAIAIEENKATSGENYLIPHFKYPEYIIPKEGVLHDFTKSDEADLETFMKLSQKYYNIPGASLALIKDGKVVYHNVFGVQNLITEKPVDNETYFQAASLTKAVFSFLVLTLVEKGVIDLDKPMYEYLKFSNLDEDERYKQMTARHVLTHRTGLPNWAFGGPGAYSSGEKRMLDFKPGEKYQYSGEGFEYLGRVIEKITNKPIQDLFNEEVIKPLNLDPLFFYNDGSLNQSRGLAKDNTPTYFGSPSETGVAHSMITEAKSFGAWVAALSRKEGLSNEMYQKLNQLNSRAEEFDSKEGLYWNVGVSLGFFVEDTHHGKAIMHGGNNGDFQAEFVLLTEKNCGFVVFTNSNTGHKLGQWLGKYLLYGNGK